jgi:hypothetical protein
MKHLTFLFLMLAVGVNVLHAAREKEQFLRANKLFQENNVEQALEEYQEISDKGPILWYNIGVCHVRQKEYLEAFVAFRRAEVGANSKLFAQLVPAIAKIQKELSIAYDSGSLLFAKQCTAFFSLFWLQVLLLILWWTYAVLSWLTISLGRGLKFCLLILLLVTATLTVLIWWVHSRDTGIVIKESSLFIGPNTEFHTVGTVHPTDQVVIGQRAEQWYKIKSTQGSGWIESTGIELIESKQ